MATVTSTEILTRFNKRMRDTDDRTFTSSEKDEFLAAALDDPYCSYTVRDTSLTTSAGASSYELPEELSANLADFGYDPTGEGFPYFLDHATYEVSEGVVYLDRTNRGIPEGKTIYLLGSIKPTSSDDIPDYLVPYIIELMSIEAFETLKSGLTTRFLKNDITMSEIIASLNTHKQRAAEIRSTLQNKRSVQG